ncbi:MAG: CDP-alcohol phosphatidyltransferase family protein [Butyrivibrio sp.]|nr:CDP-alcohol phosphatidyltransferase family protein [Muribaculum sp.]MCM1553194.1 CDP-alcohol phosphatidyltransferase family protein [Butyrivibrio sp.]
MFIGKYNRSVILTYVGVAAAFAGIAFAVRGMLAPAMIALAAAGICDLFDGVIARRCKRDESEMEFGVQIDTLADVIGFLALPAVLGMRLVDGAGIVKYLLLFGYILCGIIRLAWFNTTAAAGGVRTHYDGLPVTYAALIFPVTYAVLGFFPEFNATLIWAAEYAVIAVLFILNVKIAKPRGVWYVIFSVLAVGVIALLLVRDVL